MFWLHTLRPRVNPFRPAIVPFWGDRLTLIASNLSPENGIGVFAENLAGLGLLSCVSYIKSICCGEKSGPNATFNLFFLGSGWPWVGEFVGFILVFICFPTQQNLVNCKHPIGAVLERVLRVPKSCFKKAVFWVSEGCRSACVRRSFQKKKKRWCTPYSRKKPEKYGTILYRNIRTFCIQC